MQVPPSAQLLSLWQSSAKAWTDAVRGGQIESRRVCTDAAVVNEVLRHRPRRVLDVGCGEGWLARALAQRGVAVCGVDAVAELVVAARAAQAGVAQAAVAQAGAVPAKAAALGGAAADFQVASLADLAAPQELALARGFDLWVCNFSLFHEQDAPALLAAAARYLPAQGHLVVQTLHSNATVAAAAGQAVVDAWQPGGWGSCGTGFGDPIPWYYRSPASWQALCASHGFAAAQIQEPVHPASGRALSFLITAVAGGRANDTVF